MVSYPKRFLLAELFGSLLPVVLLILFPEAAGWMKLLSTHWFWTVIAALWWWGRGCRAEEGDCSCGSDANHGCNEVERVDERRLKGRRKHLPQMQVASAQSAGF